MQESQRKRVVVSQFERIGVLSEIFPPVKGGSGRWLYEIYRRFPSDAVILMVGDHEDAERFDADNPEVKIHRLAIRLPDWGTFRPRLLRAYWARVKSVLRLARQQCVTCIHAARVLPEGWIAYLLHKIYRIPYVVYVHGEDVSMASWSREHSWMVRRVLGRAKLVVANSHNTAELLTSDWHTDSHVMHPGVDCSYFVPAAQDAEIRESLGWGDRPTVLTVGRLQKRKGHDQMIRAVDKLRIEIPSILYAICGVGEQREHLNEMVTELGLESHVKFMGEVNDARLLQAYQQCDVFALPNREVNRDIEGFGMVLVEAQACGKPVVAGDSGGTRETMEVGVTGHIVDCALVDPLAECIAELLLNPLECKAMGVRARQFVQQRFDWTALTEAAMQLYTTESNAEY